MHIKGVRARGRESSMFEVQRSMWFEKRKKETRGKPIVVAHRDVLKWGQSGNILQAASRCTL